MPVKSEAFPHVVHSVADLRKAVGAYRAKGERVAVVPTMGALHDGHLALVEVARREAERVVVTIFVNPSQFAPREDFSRYPRDFDGDLAKLARLQTDLVFAPDVSDMYPKGFATRVNVSGLSEGLCGATRPHFFGGVATVVTKLLNQCAADVAIFGEKDYQQLLVVKRLAADLDIPTRIIGMPTVREADGVALSSRNVYLTPEQRRVAPLLHQTLQAIAKTAHSGGNVGTAIDDGFAALAAAGFAPIDYLALCDAETLVPIARLDGPGRVLGAAWLGSTRLIDNIPA
ncbi:MAG: pantoate--beta-alanine ligase [Alphaproteobacteria bacterium]|nr:pantoate--beta-alanine ligase [Alphaproteobacteria bacterium]